MTHILKHMRALRLDIGLESISLVYWLARLAR